MRGFTWRAPGPGSGVPRRKFLSCSHRRPREKKRKSVLASRSTVLIAIENSMISSLMREITAQKKRDLPCKPRRTYVTVTAI